MCKPTKDGESGMITEIDKEMKTHSPALNRERAHMKHDSLCWGWWLRKLENLEGIKDLPNSLNLVHFRYQMLQFMTVFFCRTSFVNIKVFLGFFL